MSAVTRRRPATYADLEALAPNLVGELIAGELYASPRPAVPHAVSGSALGGELYGPFQRGRGGPGGWWILFEPELHFGDDVLVPDRAGWRRDRMVSPPRQAAITQPPDWLCEVVSPSTARLDRAVKMPVYARAGVEWLWIVDPLVRLVEVYRRGMGGYTQVVVHAEDDRAHIPPFDAIELELAALWGDAPPSSPG